MSHFFRNNKEDEAQKVGGRRGENEEEKVEKGKKGQMRKKEGQKVASSSLGLITLTFIVLHANPSV